MSERAKHLLGVYRRVVDYTHDRIEELDETLDDIGDEGFIFIENNEFDKIINKAFRDEAEACGIDESTVRASLTRDIEVSTEELKQSMKDYITKTNRDLETNIATAVAVPGKDSVPNLVADLRDIY